MTTSSQARSAVGITGVALTAIAVVTAVAGTIILLTGNEASILLIIVGLGLFTTGVGALVANRR